MAVKTMIKINDSDSSSIHSLIAVLTLGSYAVLNKLKSIPLARPILEVELREATYLSYLSWEARLPDHVFDSAWKQIIESEHDYRTMTTCLNWPCLALTSLSDEFIFHKHQKPTIRLSKFNSWQQSILSRISGLPIESAANAKFFNFNHQNHLDSRLLTPQHSPLVTPHDSLIEDYIDSEGLNETHLHLNGSTHAEICWLRALIDPKGETRDFDKQWKNINDSNSSKIKELARSINPDLNPSELYKQLVVARNIRLWLIAFIDGKIKSTTPLPVFYGDLLKNNPPAPSVITFQSCDSLRVSFEKNWISDLIRNLKSKHSATFDRLFHIYLLIQSQYYRLLVQSEEQSGFDQFQKLTFTELREPAETMYLSRFLASHGSNENLSRVRYLEGRFSPKSTIKKNYDLFHAILSGYLSYLNGEGKFPKGRTLSNIKPKSLTILLDQLEDFFSTPDPERSRRQRLALVAHFIKQPWSYKDPRKTGPYRFYSLRKDLEEKSNTLLMMFNHWPKLRVWMRGIDAAANELHAPPEVFSSCYRVLQRNGITRRSYHVGEDFRHILTGIAQMLEALEFLELRDGDRIGHGTAMGISPRLWVERMPSHLYVKAGEWMLTLLATWRLLKRVPESIGETYRIECDLSDIASKIFGEDMSCTRLARIMELRKLNVRYLMESEDPNWDWRNASINDVWREEARQVAQLTIDRAEELNYLRKWLSDKNLWTRSEVSIPVEAGYLNNQLYIRTQQALMEEVRSRKVIIETLPSSNVRISIYKNFKEHHSLRWMQVPGFLEEGDPEIMVSLGSDDPGIFAGDLNSEFYQLYATLREVGLGDKSALAYLSPLNERGKQYRFHDPLLR